jgi:hypothetical protein
MRRGLAGLLAGGLAVVAASCAAGTPAPSSAEPDETSLLRAIHAALQGASVP